MGDRALRQLIVAVVGALPALAFAHGDGAPAGAWFEPWLIGLLAVSGLGYATGIVGLWRKAGIGRGIRVGETACFAAGWTVLVVSLLPPIDALAQRSFAVHMVQHEMLMVVAAPLLVLSRPLEAWTWALSTASRRVFARIASVPTVRSAWRWLIAPAVAWCFHALALWLWHVPALFTAALGHEVIHVLQHSCFFVSALVFWWAVLARRLRAPDVTSVALLFTTMLHTSALALLLTFAAAPWYAQHEPVAFGLTPLEDQQLGGLLMWVPGGFAYLAATLGIVATWLSSPRGAHRAARRTASDSFLPG